MTPETVMNPGALRVSSSPRKLMERIAILPRREASWGLIGRVIFENQFLRYITALTPFVAAMFIWPDLALPISQAPLPMLVVIGIVEMRVLRVARKNREKVTSEEKAARTLDALNYRGRRILTSIAAGRGIQSGELYLVVEQSELARVPPLTIASVQTDEGKSRIMDLTEDERRLIRDELFDDTLTEQALLLANLREGKHMRTVTFEARGVSAHARLAAVLERPVPQESPA